MKISRLFVATFFAIVLLYVLTACSSSYTTAKPVTSASKFPGVIEKAKKDHRYFVMQSGINLYTVTSVDIDKAKQQMTVTLDKVDSSRLFNNNNLGSRSNKLQKGEAAGSSQIHLYMTDSISYTLDEPHTIPLVKVKRIDMIK